MTMDESLIEIPVEDWSKLRDSFKKYEKFGLIGYNLIATQMSMNEGRDCKFRVFCPYGEMGNGIVAFIQKDKLKQLIVISSFEGTNKLEEALLTTSLIEWPKEGLEISYVEPGAKKCIDTVIKKRNLTKIYEGPCDLFLYKKGILFDVRCPNEVYISPVNPEYIPRVNEVWPHRYESSEWVFSLFIRKGLSYGLYSAQDNRLIAWMFICEAGFFTHLYCEEEYRKRGYAELIVKYVVNERMVKGLDSFCYVLSGNISSQKLFKKIGFDVVGRCCWMSVASNEIVSNNVSEVYHARTDDNIKN